MINHARTLLVNVTGDPSGFAGYPGEEYIPPSYTQLDLGSLRSVYQVLFGLNPDRVFINYRARQLMGLIHATDLADYVYALDNRVTYDVAPLDQFFYDLFQIQAVPYPGVTTPIYLLGDLQPEVKQGRSYAQWDIEVITSSTARVIKQTPPVSETVAAFTVDSGLSSPVPLDDNLSVRFEPDVNARWQVLGYARPSITMDELEASLRSLGEPLLVNVFRSVTLAGTQEPLMTFRNCWQDHPEQAFRLAGFLMAYIYRANSLLEV